MHKVRTPDPTALPPIEGAGPCRLLRLFTQSLGWISSSRGGEHGLGVDDAGVVELPTEPGTTLRGHHRDELVELDEGVVVEGDAVPVGTGLEPLLHPDLALDGTLHRDVLRRGDLVGENRQALGPGLLARDDATLDAALTLAGLLRRRAGHLAVRGELGDVGLGGVLELGGAQGAADLEDVLRGVHLVLDVLVGHLGLVRDGGTGDAGRNGHVGFLCIECYNNGQ